jgi:hypothetical protein
MVLIVGRDEILAIAEADLSNAAIIDTIENKSVQFFTPLNELMSVEPEMRSVTLQIKRQKTTDPSTSQSKSESQSESQSQSQTTVATGRRITSTSSMSDPSQDSAGGIRILSVKEKTVDTFANQFLRYVVTGLWPGGIPLNWVRGREKTTLRWTETYTSQTTPYILLFYTSLYLVVSRSFGFRFSWTEC